MSFFFKFIKPNKNKNKRLGQIITPNGIIETPAFIFCATKSSIKSLSNLEIKKNNTQVILVNTYHLMNEPETKIIKNYFKLRQFINWKGPMFSDSGGFQVFSLSNKNYFSEIKYNCKKELISINEEGVIFKYYNNNKKHLITPEKSIKIQKSLGADLIVSFDECTPFNVNKKYVEKSMKISHRWSLRSYNEIKKNYKRSQALYGIIQGGIYNDLRIESCDFVNKKYFFGHAIGGSLGVNQDQMLNIIRDTIKKLDKKRPIHLLGVGKINDIIKAIDMGIDTFDCVHPTRIARHGEALIINSKEQSINLNNCIYYNDNNPIEKECDCSTCKKFSRSYLRNLLKSFKSIAIFLITIHNVRCMNRLMENIRKNLKQQINII